MESFIGCMFKPFKEFMKFERKKKQQQNNNNTLYVSGGSEVLKTSL